MVTSPKYKIKRASFKNSSSTNFDINKVCLLMMEHQITLKLLHFQTKLYGAHKTIDTYLTTFSTNFDRFMEVAQGSFGVVTLSSYDIQHKTLSDKTVFSYMDKFVKSLESLTHSIKNCTDLLNIKDELIAEANQLTYLLKFK